MYAVDDGRLFHQRVPGIGAAGAVDLQSYDHSRDLSSVPGKLITTGSFATSGSQLLSYSFTYFGTSASTLPSDTSDFHSPKVNSSLSTSSSDAPWNGP